MSWFYNLKISMKLILAFVIVAIIAGIVGIVGIINITDIDKRDTEMYEKMTKPLSELVTIVESYQRTRGNMRDILLSKTKSEIDDYKNRITARNVEFEAAESEFKKTLITDAGKAAVADLEKAKADYDKAINQMISLVEQGKNEDAIKILRSDGETAVRAIETATNTIKKMKVDLASTASDENSSKATFARYLMIGFIIGGMLLAVLLGIFISRIISNPLNKLVSAADRISQGDLDITIEVASRDEIGTLSKAFSLMADNMNEVMSNINSSAEQVAAGSRQVSSSSQILSQGSTEQASSIEEITSSMTQIASQTKQNADNANKANELAVNAKENAERGNAQMQDMVKAMAEINDSSANISKIIKVIDEIAFQTNILALNAAVEAARAGQHGKGFAVVAEEVRNLAARSANAAKETTAMIEGSIKKVEVGSKIANETAAALNEIVNGVAKAATLVGDIAIASNEQANGISQINQAISQVAMVVQSNSATAEESASASEELSSQAELLKDSVRKFKLKKISSGSYYHSESLSPDVLRMIESMMDKKKNAAKPAAEIPAAINPLPAAKKKISLDDGDFGKY